MYSVRTLPHVSPILLLLISAGILSGLVGCGGGGGDSRTVMRTVALRGTGFSENGTPLVNVGSQDANWVTVSNEFLKPALLLTPAGPNWWPEWLVNSPTSQWIGAANVENPGPAPYWFQLNFQLGDLDPERTELVGKWAIDDDGTVDINGVTIDELTEADQVQSGNWVRLNDFKVEAGSGVLHSGNNEIRLTIRATDNYLAGARFEGYLNELAAD